jgi:hypothetical protein
MEMVSQGSFEESPLTAWALSNASAVNSFLDSGVNAPDGAKALRVNPSGTATQAVATTPADAGDEIRLFYYTFSSEAGKTLAVQVDFGSGAFVTVGAVPLGSVTFGYQLKVVSIAGLPFTGPGRLRLTTSGASTARVYVDQVSLTISGGFIAMAKRSRWLATAALQNALKGINGAPLYHTDLDDKVFTRLFTPAESGAPRPPYLCMPWDADAPVLSRNDSGGSQAGYLRMAWRQVVYGFVHDPLSSQNRDTGAVEPGMKLYEDVIQNLFRNPTLGGTVAEVNLLDGGFGTAGTDDIPYGEFRVPLEMVIYFGLDVLGP